MKFTLICILLIFIGISQLRSQQNLLNKRVTIEFREKKISDAVSILNKKMGNIFSYKNNIFSSKIKITMKFNNEPLKNVLEKMFSEASIVYFQTGDQIILKKAKEIKKEEKSELLEMIPDERLAANYSVIHYIPFQTGRVFYTFSRKLGNNMTDEDYMFEAEQLPIVEPEVVQADFSEIAAQKKRGKHSLLFSPGLKTNSKTSVVTDGTSVSMNSGVTATFSYGYMLSDSWQLNFLTGVFVAEADVIDTTVSAKAIIPLSVGFRHYPNFLKISDFGNVYVGGNIGAYIGFGTEVSGETGTVGAAETQLGANLSIGMDIFPFKWMKIGPNVSFHLISEFKSIFNESKNYSGTEFSFNMGILF